MGLQSNKLEFYYWANQGGRVNTLSSRIKPGPIKGGGSVYADGKYHEATFYHEPLVGRSGRGDNCIASYAAKRLSAPPAEAIIWSAALTSLKMEAEGPIKKTKADVEALIKRKYRLG